MVWLHFALTLTTLVVVEGCLDGWTLHGDMCYKGSANRATADQAKSECEALQAVLASVHNEETATFINTLMNGNDVWIGLQPNFDASGYHCLDGSETTYLPWAIGETQCEIHSGYESTVCVRLSGSKLKDMTCSSSYRYTCMRETFLFVYAADTMYCTEPCSSMPQDDALLQEAKSVLRDQDSSSYIQLFPDGRTLFQISADYPPITPPSLSVWFSGVGIQCEKFVTVYFERATDNCLPSGKHECAFVEQTSNTITPTNTDCLYRCYALISSKDDVRVSLITLSKEWSSESHKLSQLCEFKLTIDY